MRWIEDITGRFGNRPWYENEELDDICETIIRDFLIDRHDVAQFPISTDDLTVLVEQHTSDFDQFSDLSADGANVEGVTDFFPDRSPVVRIAEHLQGQSPWKTTRFRTTLTHELGHVVLHGPLVPRGQLPLFDAPKGEHLFRCTRETVLAAGASDWVEWQAGYASGAFLMPRTFLMRVAEQCGRGWRRSDVPVLGSRHADDLVGLVQREFQVSKAAAEVRLLQQSLLLEHPPAATALF